VREKLRLMGSLNPMTIFLRQEMHRIDRLIRIVRYSLDDLLLAIDGVIILNDVRKQSIVESICQSCLVIVFLVTSTRSRCDLQWSCTDRLG
jgi:hypothetical protein